MVFILDKWNAYGDTKRVLEGIAGKIERKEVVENSYRVNALSHNPNHFSSKFQ